MAVLFLKTMGSKPGIYAVDSLGTWSNELVDLFLREVCTITLVEWVALCKMFSTVFTMWVDALTDLTS